MFSLILNCPECNEAFNFDKDGALPENIKCQSCGKTSPASSFEALVLCKECRKKLYVPLDIVDDPDLRCPLCDAPVSVETSDDEDKYLSSPESDSAHAVKQLLADGTFFDKYKIVSLLGRGGMAEVYLAEHLLLKKRCAIKILHNNGHNNDAVFTKRFIREAKISHSLEHPNIVKVFDAGCDFKSGRMFIAMEYVEGKTLMQLAKEKPLTEDELLDVLGAMAEALKVLKEHNIVHRDIKPSNIMLSDDGVFKLMDLGIAKVNSDHQAGEFTLTMDQQTIGTPSFASPEQCQSAHKVDFRSDIYCLGATLYSLASGKVPFDGTSSVEIILKVINHDYEPLKNLRSDLSRGFLTMVDRMMRKSPDERPDSLDELITFANTGKMSRLKISDIPLICRRIFRKTPQAVKYVSGTLLLTAVAASLFYFFAADRKADKTPSKEQAVVTPAAKSGQEKQNTATGKPENLTGNKPEAPTATTATAPAEDDKKPADKEEQAGKQNQTASVSDQKANISETAVKLKKSASTAITKSLEIFALAQQPKPEAPALPAADTKPQAQKKAKSAPASAPVKKQIKFQKKIVIIPQLVSPQRQKVRTIKIRIEECRERLAKVKATPDLPYKEETIKFINAQLQELEQQKEIRDNVLDANKRHYSATNSRNLAEILKKLDSERSYSSKDLESVFKLLKQKNTDPNLFYNDTNRIGDFLLKTNLSSKHTWIQFLKTKHFDVNLLNEDILSSISNTNFSNFEIITFGLENIDLASQYLFTSSDSKSSSILSHIYKYNFSNIYRMLLLSPKLSATDRNGDTLMHKAAEFNCCTLAKKLLYAGFSNFEQRNDEGKSPWDTALEHGSREIAEFLAEHGFATLQTNSDMRYIELFDAIKHNDPDTVKKLIAGGLDPYIRTHSDMSLDALNFACIQEPYNPEIIESILSSPNAKYRRHNSGRRIAQNHPLYTAILKDSPELFRLLLSKGVSYTGRFGSGTNIAQTILLHTTRHRHQKTGKAREEQEKAAVEMIKTLLELTDFDVNKDYYNGLRRDGDMRYIDMRVGPILTSVVRPSYAFTNQNIQYELTEFLIGKGAVLPDDYPYWRISPKLRPLFPNHTKEKYERKKRSTQKDREVNEVNTINTSDTKSQHYKGKQKYRQSYR